MENRGVILITGSSGLIGSATCDRFGDTFRVIGFDREGPPQPPPSAECVCVDLSSDDSVRKGLERVRRGYGDRIESVIHLAAYYDFSGEPSPLYDEITVRGTNRLLRALHKFEVGQFIFSSTMLVHAPCQPGERIDELWPLEPKWDYPSSKVRAEETIQAERGPIPVVILRIAGVYTGRCQSLPLAHQMQRIYERRLTSRVFPGDLSHGQAYVHLDDVVEAISLTVERRGDLPPESVLLIGEEDTLSYDDLQQAFGRSLHDEDWETKQIPKGIAKTGAWLQDLIPGEEPFIKPWMIDLADDHYALDTSRARKTLDWKARCSLRATLPAMAAALKDDPARFYAENDLGEPPAIAIHATHGRPAGDSRQHGATRQETKATSQAARNNAHGDEHARQSTHTEAARGEAVDHDAMVRDMRRGWLWTNWTIVALGLWLATSPVTFGYQADQPMFWSDTISGLLLAAFAAGALVPTVRTDFWGRWGIATVGLWLQFAPLIFWADSPAAYVSDTLIGSFAIALSVLVPMMPGMAHHMEMMKPGPEIPPGWTYNPSSWLQRGPIIALGLAGWFISRGLAGVQLGYIPATWEPFFGPGTERVLHSEVSRMWPISDAGLGAAAYTLEVLMGFMGPVTRWRTMPWMVLLFGILVVPLGLTHITLVILQPVVVGEWCTMCLAAAALMLLMIPLTVDEVVAMFQFMARVRREKRPFWRTFWVGGTIEGGKGDDRSPPFGEPMPRATPAMFWGVTAPWTLLVCAALGVWLMVSPAFLGTTGAAADSDRIGGALALTVAVIATAEVIRGCRFLNVALGLWIALSAWVLPGAGAGGRWGNLAVGLVLAALSIPRGTIRERYGRWGGASSERPARP